MKMKIAQKYYGWILAVAITTGGIPSRGQEGKPWPKLESWTNGAPLPGTAPLDMQGDLSLELAKRNDRFLDRQIAATAEKREQYWRGPEAAPENRKELARMLGLDRDQRAEFPDLMFLPIMNSETATVRLAKWRAFGGVHGYGVLAEPVGDAASKADVILLADSDDSAADTLSSLEKVDTLAGELLRAGCRVLLIQPVTRANHPKYPMPLREWLHRPAYELGRTLAGYELHQIFSAADWFSLPERTLGIVGTGEGGRLAFYAAALDDRFAAAAVHGYFGPRENLWKEPSDRNVFGLLTRFGDAELARLIHPRSLYLVHHGAPDFSYRAGPDGEPEILTERSRLPGKPGVIPKFTAAEVAQEWNRIGEGYRSSARVHASGAETQRAFLEKLGLGDSKRKIDPGEIAIPRGAVDQISRSREAVVREIERHNQEALTRASADRAAFWKNLKTDSLQGYAESAAPYREQFRTGVIGDFEAPRKPFAARSRPFQKGEKTVSYEVVLDVMDEVIAYGILTLPKDLDLQSGKKLPVVVCQHGLEGRPQDVVGEPKYRAYKAFATRLAEEGFITFSPQNGYRYYDLFRMQQFKAQSIGKTLFSTIVPQHLQITDWLASLPFVEEDKIGFYGLSYGGKSAMRIPPLVERYCLSICSADFNEWVWKNAATDEGSLRYSYANKGEYEIFEWNLGGAFNYAEMAALIAPRPFMVERGHFDGVAPDERVGFEFGKVRHLYQAKLGIGDRCEIEWFVGPHTINGQGTFRFLKKHLFGE